MDLSGQASQARFASYVEALVEVIGHADRAEPLNDYCVGLLMPGERKSVEPMAAIVAPARVSAKHQSLLHLVGHELEITRRLRRPRAIADHAAERRPNKRLFGRCNLREDRYKWSAVASRENSFAGHR